MYIKHVTSLALSGANDYNLCRTSILISIDGANSSTYAQYQRQRDFIANQLVTNKWNHFDRIAVSTQKQLKLFWAKNL
jgi:hypothetical protein